MVSMHMVNMTRHNQVLYSGLQEVRSRAAWQLDHALLLLSTKTDC